ncbi:MAG: tetratricopeptide repeat protein [Bacteroidetes bacterium]|nr:tetratricopeptide repeat protein [Bacteroidota bacterium]
MKSGFFLLCFQLSSFLSICFSQKSIEDSLLTALGNSNEDTGKISILLQLFENCDEKNMLKYSEEALRLSEKLYDKRGVASSLNNLGYVYANFGKMDEALEYYLKSMKIWEELDDKKGIATALNELGFIYDATGRRDKALESYEKSLTIRMKLGDKKDIGYSLNNIGVEYKIMGNLDKALVYFMQSLDAWESAKHIEGISTALNNIGFCYYIKNNLLDALQYYHKGLELQKEIRNMFGVGNSLNNIGAVYHKLGDEKKAIEYSEEALKIAQENNYPEFIARAAKLLADIYSLKAQKAFGQDVGSWKKAYEYHKFYSEMKDTLLNQESSKQITEMQTKYETEKKEQQIALLNKDKELQDAQMNRQKIIIWSVAAGLLVALILSVFIFRERRKSEKLLLNILPAETARELKQHGKATAKHYENVTVMFTDFKNFTDISEKLSAEELVSELDFLFKKFDEVISKYPIEKIKTIGDAYMCVGGLPTANTTNAMDVVKAAMEIQNWMKGQSNKWSLRIGIHTGSVTAGVVGDKKFAYDIWGDTVNTASRMESSGKAGKINISGTTQELIKNKFSCQFRGKIPAKNKGEIEMYFVEQNSI